MIGAPTKKKAMDGNGLYSERVRGGWQNTKRIARLLPPIQPAFRVHSNEVHTASKLKSSYYINPKRKTAAQAMTLRGNLACAIYWDCIISPQFPTAVKRPLA